MKGVRVDLSKVDLSKVAISKVVMPNGRYIERFLYQKVSLSKGFFIEWYDISKGTIRRFIYQKYGDVHIPGISSYKFKI